MVWGMADGDGFRCTRCNKFHAFDGYVYAHMHDQLIHTCDADGCNTKHIIYQGTAYNLETTDPDDIGSEINM